MDNRWNDDEADGIAVAISGQPGHDLRRRVYSARLLGMEPDLVLHGGGNVSLKTALPNVFGETAPVTFVKASGYDLKTIEESGFVALDHEYLARLSTVDSLSEAAMRTELGLHLALPHTSLPSIEALMHVFLAPKYIDHTHPASILALTNRTDGERCVSEALGGQIGVIPYVEPGFGLAKVAREVFENDPTCEGLVLMHHGLITWGETARGAYSKTIELVSRAEEYLEKRSTGRSPVSHTTATAASWAARYRTVAPVLRGLLTRRAAEREVPGERVILRPLLTETIVAFLEDEQGKELALMPPLTPDNLIRTGLHPLWIERPAFDDEAELREQLATAIAAFSRDYGEYLRRHAGGSDVQSEDILPKTVMLPGMGVACAGRDVREATIARDVTDQTLAVKAAIVESGGTYVGLSESQLYDMEYNAFQRAKLERPDAALPPGTVALVTGSAGAIGYGICEKLLDEGCHVAATDLSGTQLDSMVDALRERYGHRVIGVALDVTQEADVTDGFGAVVDAWGGIDLLVVNAGLAHVSSLADMELQAFRRLERVNIEGVLLVLREAARLFERQGAGGDVVVVSTKNVFAPSGEFGAYSATKAACHQLARVASLELAALDVRVNMVSPDAVFSHGGRRSGLWAEVGPARMRARGLDEAGLEEYYRNRNLLKAKVTAEHVAKAVMFFATRQTPTTGATIPVDGGLPDATPR